MRITPWFPPNTKPTRRGVYLTSMNPSATAVRGFWFQYWSGTYWKTRSDTVLGAYKLKAFKSQHQEVYWKGMEK